MDSALPAGSPPASPARCDCLDLLKSVAIFLMVIFHYNGLDISFWEAPSAATWGNYFFSSFFCLCVPILFFVNGALLLNRPFSLERHVKKTVSLAILTVIWAVITLLALMALNGEVFSPGVFFRDLWYWKQDYINHLWFLLTLFWIYLCLPFLVTAQTHMPRALSLLTLCVTVFVFGNSILLYLANLIQFISGLRVIQGNFNFFNQFSPFTGNFGFALGYFLLGGHLHAKRDRLGTPRARRIACIVFVSSMLLLNAYGILMSALENRHFVLGTSSYPSFCFLFAVAALYVLTMRYTACGLPGRIIRCVGSNTLAVLFLHRIVAVALFKCFPDFLSRSGIPGNLLFSLAVVAICTAIGSVCIRIPVLRKLFQT